MEEYGRIMTIEETDAFYTTHKRLVKKRLLQPKTVHSAYKIRVHYTLQKNFTIATLWEIDGHMATGVTKKHPRDKYNATAGKMHAFARAARRYHIEAEE